MSGRCGHRPTSRRRGVLIPFSSGQCPDPADGRLRVRVAVLIPFSSGQCPDCASVRICDASRLNPFFFRAVSGRYKPPASTTPRRLNPFFFRAVSGHEPRRSTRGGRQVLIPFSSGQCPDIAWGVRSCRAESLNPFFFRAVSGQRRGTLTARALGLNPFFFRAVSGRQLVPRLRTSCVLIPFSSGQCPDLDGSSAIH